MKCIILLNTDKYRYHKDLSETIKNCDYERDIEFYMIDFADKGQLHDKYFAINSINPDLIINLDGTGFALKTENDGLSLNAFSCRIINLMLQKPDYYGQDIKLRQNLSMYTFFPNRIVDNENNLKKLIEKYPNVPNLGLFCDYNHKASSEDEKKNNKENLSNWIVKIIPELRL